MKVNYQILSLALIFCVAFLLMRDGISVSPSEVVLENIHSRTSIREYTAKQIPEETLQELVRAAMAAPTAGNMQPWQFTIVQDKETLEKMSQINNSAKPVGSAAAAIIVTADMNTYADKNELFKAFWVTDCSLAAQNILLAANSMGIGSVWLSVYPFEDKDKNLRKIIDFKENTNIMCIISLGYPANEVAPKDKYKAEKISIAKSK